MTLRPILVMGGMSGERTNSWHLEHQYLAIRYFLITLRGAKSMSSSYLTTVSTGLSKGVILQEGHVGSVNDRVSVISSSLGFGRWYPGVPGFLPLGFCSPFPWFGLYRYESSYFR